MATVFFVYILPISVLIVAFIAWQKYRSRMMEARHEESLNKGLGEPVSLHPVIDPAQCVGCGACVRACPEGDILGLIRRKATLVSPASCIGHGACKTACPVDAISLVFGTETRGVDIPHLSSDFETNIPGMYIAGELGGMGLIRNAIKQGVETIDNIVDSHLSEPHNYDYDVVIVGAGPAGLSAGLAALAKRLDYAILEQDTVGGALAHYPRGKVVMTAPAKLPIVGEFQFTDTEKESLIDFWDDTVNKTGLRVQGKTRVEAVHRERQGFTIETSQGQYTSRTVLLALGRRGTPRKLEVPGEDLTKVVYGLVDAAQYQNEKVLVVGGGDSALEAAVSLTEVVGCQVTLAVRGESFSANRIQNREAAEAKAEEGALTIYYSTKVEKIGGKKVVLGMPEGSQKIDNDYVIVCAGGILPTKMLQASGIDVETKFGTE